MDFYQDIFEKSLNKFLLEIKNKIDNKNLVDPIFHQMQAGGKRIRPMFFLRVFHMFSNELENSLPLALALEWTHNFTLVHDDIMDKSFYRRNILTINAKWNDATAILVGDLLLIQVYQLLGKIKNSTDSGNIIYLFNQAIQKSYYWTTI